MFLTRKYLTVIPMVLLLATLSLVFLPEHASAGNTLTWCSYTWYVSHDSTPTLGTRNPSSTNVWVDDSGYLHLRLRKINGYWCGSQVQTSADLGYGVYQWQVEGRPDLLDYNVAFAMFGYPRDWEDGQEGGCEWDYEWGKWGNPDRKYNLDLSCDTAWGYADLGRAWRGVMLKLPSNVSTYRFTRTRQSVHFEIFNGAVAVSSTATHLVNWLYAPTDWAKRIPNIAEPVLMNLYAFEGKAPSDGLAEEMVIRKFSFVAGEGTPSTSTDTPSVPSLSSPANGAYTKDSTPLLDWSTVTSDSAVSYLLQVDNDADFSSLVISSSSITSSSYTVKTALADGTYYWRVKAKDADGDASGWTASRSFTVDTVAPPVPSLSSPANGAHTNDSTPFLDWSTVTDASPVHYSLQVDNNADFSPLVFGSSSITSSSYTVKTARADGTYYWRVMAKDAAGNASAWTAPWYFTVSTDLAAGDETPPGSDDTPTVPSVPSADDTTYDGTPTVNSAPAVSSAPSGTTSGLTSLVYCYSALANDGDSDALSCTFDWGDGTTSTTLQVDSGSTTHVCHTWNEPGTYAVRVMATDSRGAFSAWSDTTAVTVIREAVAAPCEPSQTASADPNAVTDVPAEAQEGNLRPESADGESFAQASQPGSGATWWLLPLGILVGAAILITGAIVRETMPKLPGSFKGSGDR